MNAYLSVFKVSNMPSFDVDATKISSQYSGCFNWKWLTSCDFEIALTAHQFNFWLDYETICFKSEVTRFEKQCITKTMNNKLE